MDEEKHNVEPGILGTKGRTYHGRGIVRAFEGDRKPIEYSYSVVHAQESIRLLDLRVASDAGIDLGYLQQLFRAIEARVVLDAAIRELPDDYWE